MKIFIVRHGQDDDTVRGGWSDGSLTEFGVRQSEILADELANGKEKYQIGKIYSSDLARARQTAEIISERLDIPVEYSPLFREVNNGDLAGMKNDIAEKLYPNLFWRNLQWDERYPNGESPEEFYMRIIDAWHELVQNVSDCAGNVLLITHGGVINIIRCIVDGSEHSNTRKFPAAASTAIALEAEISA